jgi:hypothetical protein
VDAFASICRPAETASSTGIAALILLG